MFPVTLPNFRVLFVIPGEARGSSMVFARRQAEALRAIGIEVACFYLCSRTSPRVLRGEARRFRKTLTELRPDIVHAHFGTMTAFFTVALSRGIPIVVTYRGSDLNFVPSSAGLRSAIGRVLSQIAALGATRIVCVSSSLRDRLWWRKKLATVLPSGVDTNMFHPMPLAEARRQLSWSESPPIILFNAGHNARNKRLDLAEKTLALVRLALPEARMEILRGDTPPHNMPLLLNAADCLLVTSDAEGAPSIFQEALATNLPVVSVDVGDAETRLLGVFQCAVVPRDAAALSAAVVSVLRARLRSNGRERAHEISIERVAAELARIYRQAAQAAPHENFAWNTTLF